MIEFLTAKFQEEYNALADEDKQRFMVELKEYQQTEDYQKLLQRKRNEKEAAGELTHNSSDMRTHQYIQVNV